MNRRILVTGATGKVGTETLKQLSLFKGEGWITRAALHSDEKKSTLAGIADETVLFDFESEELIAKALAEVDTLFLITPPHFKQVDWATSVIDHAVRAGVKRVVRLSVIAAGMEPGIQIGRWHREVEEYLANAGMEYTILRPGPFMQNFLGMYPRQNGSYSMNASNAVVNHIDVRDVALVAAKVLLENNEGRHNGKTYAITGGGGISFAQATEQIGKITGRSIDYKDETPESVATQMQNMGRPPWLIEVLLELFETMGKGGVAKVLPTYSEFTDKANTTFDQFVSDYKASF